MTMSPNGQPHGCRTADGLRCGALTPRPGHEGRHGNRVTGTAVEDLQNRLQQHLATHVIIHHGDKRGRIEIEYYGTDDLQRIVTALGLPVAGD